MRRPPTGSAPRPASRRPCFSSPRLRNTRCNNDFATSLLADWRSFGRGPRRRCRPAPPRTNERVRAGRARLSRARLRLPARRQRRQQHDRAADHERICGLRCARARPWRSLQAPLLPITSPSGEVYGLHPQLKGLQQLFQQRRLAIVANVGTLVRPLTRDEYQGCNRAAAAQPVLPSRSADGVADRASGGAGDDGMGRPGRRSRRRTWHDDVSCRPCRWRAMRSSEHGARRRTRTIVPGMAPDWSGMTAATRRNARLQSFDGAADAGQRSRPRRDRQRHDARRTAPGAAC